jgi:hypothetical protein
MAPLGDRDGAWEVLSFGDDEQWLQSRIALLRCVITLLSAVASHTMTAVALHAQAVTPTVASVARDAPPLAMIGTAVM